MKEKYDKEASPDTNYTTVNKVIKKTREKMKSDIARLGPLIPLVK